MPILCLSFNLPTLKHIKIVFSTGAKFVTNEVSVKLYFSRLQIRTSGNVISYELK
jgi:hypothetical protein